MDYATAFFQLVALAAFGGWMNAVRGGAYPWKINRALNAISFGLVALLFVEHWWQAPLCALAMFAGAAPSVGEIVGDDGILGGHLEAHKLAVQRGAFWGALIALAAHNFGPLVAGLTFGMAYQFGYAVWLQNKSANAWQIGEIIFGATLWSSLLWGWG